MTAGRILNLIRGCVKETEAHSLKYFDCFDVDIFSYQK